MIKHGLGTTSVTIRLTLPASQMYLWKKSIHGSCPWHLSARLIVVKYPGLLVTHSYIYIKIVTPCCYTKVTVSLFQGKWQPIGNAGNPFEFDYAAYCKRSGIFYQQSCSVNDIRLYSANNPGATSFIDRAHDLCMQQLDKYITDPKTKGLIQAMILGDEVNLDEDLRQSYADTGIIHIIAISGGNVAIFFMAISFLLLWLRHKQHMWIKYAIALPLVWFYVLMAGAAPSAIRAAVMFSLLAFSVMLEKNNNSFLNPAICHCLSAVVRRAYVVVLSWFSIVFCSCTITRSFLQTGI